MSISSETTLFAIFLLDGAIVGLLFDIFRVLRRSFKTPDFITYIEDIGFGIISGAVIIFSIIIFNNGELRLFIFCGILLGLIIYMLTISKYIINVSVKIIKFLTRITNIIFNIVFFPVTLMLKKLIQLYKNLQKQTKNPKKNKGLIVEK